MGSRLGLHNLLLSIGGPNVYYQAPSSMVYPAIKYEIKNIENTHANDSVYYQKKLYSITVISRTVDDNIVSKISMLPLCLFDRYYVSDNLHHTVFNLYY